MVQNRCKIQSQEAQIEPPSSTKSRILIILDPYFQTDLTFPLGELMSSYLDSLPFGDDIFDFPEKNHLPTLPRIWIDIFKLKISNFDFCKSFFTFSILRTGPRSPAFFFGRGG